MQKGLLTSNKLEANKNTIFSLMVVLFVIVLFKTAWVSDDAAITLRTVLNFINGYGPVFNVGERVQAYTHPLWFLIISVLSLVIGNVFYATLLCSFVFSIIAIYLLLFQICKSFGWGLVASVVLLLSKSFIDYSTSGLENPLSFVLLATMVLVIINERFSQELKHLILVLIGSLMFLTRPDLVLFIIPPILYSCWLIRSPKKIIWFALPGIIVLASWISFSLVYYGFPLPNTAYAKLGMGIHSGELILQGFWYYLDSLSGDPITLAFIVFTGVICLSNKDKITLQLLVGILLYLLYILKIGGDFMSGRFFAVIVFACAILLVLQPRINSHSAYVIVGLFLMVGVISNHDEIFTDSKYHDSEIKKTGIANERGFYFKDRGLISGTRTRYLDLPPWVYKGSKHSSRKVKHRCGRLGYKSIYDGPNIHYIDSCALADPLLARLPAKYKKNWRIGHFVRVLPLRYVESIKSKQNLLSDKSLAEYYGRLLNVVSGELLTSQRFIDIIALNTGQLDHLIDNKTYLSKPVSHVKDIKQLDRKVFQGTLWDAPGNLILEKGVPLVIEAASTDFLGKQLQFSTDHNDSYMIRLLENERVIWSHLVKPNSERRGLIYHIVEIPNEPLISSANSISITAVSGDGRYSLGHLKVIGN